MNRSRAGADRARGHDAAGRPRMPSQHGVGGDALCRRAAFQAASSGRDLDLRRDEVEEASRMSSLLFA